MAEVVTPAGAPTAESKKGRRALRALLRVCGAKSRKAANMSSMDDTDYEHRLSVRPPRSGLLSEAVRL